MKTIQAVRISITTSLLALGLTFCSNNNFYKGRILRQIIEVHFNDESVEAQSLIVLSPDFEKTKRVLEMPSLVTDYVLQSGADKGDLVRHKNGRALLFFTPSNDSVRLTFKINYTRSINLIKDPQYIYISKDLEYVPRFENDTQPQEIEINFFLPDNFKVLYPEITDKSQVKIVSEEAETLLASNSQTPVTFTKNFTINHFLLAGKKTGAVESINNTIDSALVFYKNELGTTLKSKKSFGVYYIDRRGGYAVDDGIVLSKDYLDRDLPSLLDKGLFAHEVAHQTWGRRYQFKNPVLSEALAEYFAGRYMAQFDKSVMFYGKKSVECEMASLSANNIDHLDPSQGGLYRQYAYKRLPIIFNYLAFKHSHKLFTKCVTSLNEEHPITINSFYGAFDANQDMQQELQFYLEGGILPDFYVQDVTAKNVAIKGDNVKFRTKVPIKIEFSDKSSRLDTLHFDSASTNVLSLKSTKAVAKVTIDPEFILAQDKVSNDTWPRTTKYFGKYPRTYDDKYYDATDELLSYLFYEKEPLTTQLPEDSKTRSTLAETANKFHSTKELKFLGYELALDSFNGKTVEFEIIVTFEFNGKVNYGSIKGSFIESTNTSIGINKISSIKI